MSNSSKKTRIPTYREHKQSGQAIVTLPNGMGGRKDILLGKYDTPESRLEYKRVVLEWEAQGRTALATMADITINELILKYFLHVKQHYRDPDGTPTSEVNNIRYALRWVQAAYGHTVAKNFGPSSLEAVQTAMIKGRQDADYTRPGGLCRNQINKNISRIKRMFRWAAAKEILSHEVWTRLQAVEGLRAGRSNARERPPVQPVPMSVVDATLPWLQPTLRDMVMLQYHTGMRPGELLAMRTIDIDTTGVHVEGIGKVWLYRPRKHKTAHRGHQRIIAVAPKAQAILKRYRKTNLEAYLFSPREVMERFRTEQRARRKSRVQPSQRNRRKKRPAIVPGESYTTSAYAGAIGKAIKRANREAARKAGDQPAHLIPHWHPHQIRHTKGTELQREFGIETARACLGHRSPAVTEVYVQRDIKVAAEAMAKLG